MALRYFNVAGADPKGRTGHRARATHLLKVAGERRRARHSTYSGATQTADGTGVSDYIHVSDLIAAHGAPLGHLRGGGENGMNWATAAASARCRCPRDGAGDGPAAAGPRCGAPAGRPPPAIVAGAERARQVLGWSPRHDDLYSSRGLCIMGATTAAAERLARGV